MHSTRHLSELFSSPYSSGNTSSVVHTDDYDNINCLLQGDKQFILLDPNTYSDVADEVC